MQRKNIIEPYEGLYEFDRGLFQRTINDKMDCKVKDVESGSEEGSIKVNFSNANSLYILQDISSGKFRAKYEYRGTSNLFFNE